MPVRKLARLTQHLDRRGLVLLAVGMIWALYGLGTVIAPSRRFRHLGSGVIENALNSRWWGVLWLLCGLTAVAVGVRHARRRVSNDAAGFNAVLLPPLLWTLLYAFSTVAHVVTWGAIGDGRAWISAVIWGLFVLLILILAGWPDPQWVPARPDEPGAEVT